MGIENSRFYQLAFGFMSDMQEANNRMETRIFKEWEESKSMPRKMKKRRRKEILVDYSILQYSRNLIPNL